MGPSKKGSGTSVVRSTKAHYIGLIYAVYKLIIKRTYSCDQDVKTFRSNRARVT